MTTWGAPLQADVAVAGAGIVGLAVAAEAARRGLKVVVVDRDLRASGASVRNFGHIGTTVQAGRAAGYAELTRSRWLELRAEAGLEVRETGTVVVARSELELAVLREFASASPAVTLSLDGPDIQRNAPLAGDGLLGGVLLPRDLRVDPRSAVPVFAAHLAARGVDLRSGVSALGADTGVLHTTAGDVRADAVVVAVGHDLDRLLPDQALAAGLVRCTLHMLRVAAPGGRRFEPAVLTGTSMLRYGAFQDCPSLSELRAELGTARPELLEQDVNLMLTQHPSGDLLIGDTHSYAACAPPFAAEELDDLLLDETERLLGVPALHVKERWRGTYAYCPDRDFLLTAPADGVRAIAVTSGIGMTTAFGFAQDVLDDVLAQSPQPVP